MATKTTTTFKVRIHETSLLRRVREVEIEIPARDTEHARALAQACYPNMLPSDVGIRVISDNETHESDHQASAGVEVFENQCELCGKGVDSDYFSWSLCNNGGRGVTLHEHCAAQLEAMTEIEANAALDAASAAEDRRRALR